MKRRITLLLIVFAALHPWAVLAQTHDPGSYPLAIRGEVWIDREPIYGDRVDQEYPLNKESTARRALQEASLYFSGMIYGWSFHYDIGERARGITEDFYIFEPMGEIHWGDSRLRVTDAENRETKLRIWADYQLSEAQQKRMHFWQMGTVRNVQALGYCSLRGPDPDSDWLGIRNTAVKDAARSAVREMLRGSERNRPKEAVGFISLAAFPRFFIDSGRWVTSARFRIQINEIIPFAAY